MTTSTADTTREPAGQTGPARNRETGRNAAMLMGAVGVTCAIAAGALLWWREGDRLFTDGLVSALMRCF